MPALAMPAAMAVRWLSQMPVSIYRAGNSFSNLERPVPSGMAAVSATTRESFLASAIMASAKAVVQDLPGPLMISTRQPLTWNAAGLWNLVGSLAGDLVAVALDGLHMQDHRRLHVLDLGEHIDQARQIVAVERAEVFDAKRFEDLARPERALDAVGTCRQTCSTV